MGTDINYIFQKRNGDQWETLNVDQDIHHDEKWENWSNGEFYISRHYLLFAVLADIRNGFGFAGTLTHVPVVPIAPRRGLPDGISSNWFEQPSGGAYGIEFDEDHTEYLDLGDHSFTWLTSTEILNWFETKHELQRFGVVDLETYDLMERGKEPDNYSSGISGGDIDVYDETGDELSFRLVRPFRQYRNVTHVRTSWYVNVNEELMYFHDMIKKLHDQYGEIRMVMGFDS